MVDIRDPAAERYRVVVVGGGVAGLSAAHALTTGVWSERLSVTVLEAAPQLGGKLRSADVAGVSLDVGGEALLSRRPETATLLTAAGLTDAVVPAATSTARIHARGALRSFPSGHVLGVPTEARELVRTGLLSRAEGLRVALEPSLRRPGPVDAEATDDASVAEFLGPRLGRPVVRRLVEPLLGGVYAGRPEALGLAATMPQLAAALLGEPSLLRAARGIRRAAPPATGPVFVSLSGGLGQLPTALAAATPATVRTGTVVRELRRTAEGWQLTCGPASGAGAELIDAGAVVLAVPATAASRLLRGISPVAASALAEIDYASVAVVTLALPRSGLTPDQAATLAGGSGFLVASEAGRTVKGVTFSSTKWGWLAAEAPELAMVRASVGRSGEEAVLQRTDEEILTVVRHDLAALAGISATPVDATVTRWGGALPQYAPGHLRRVRSIRDDLPDTLAVCGAAYDGVGVPACAGSGRVAAAHVLQTLAARGRMEQ